MRAVQPSGWAWTRRLFLSCVSLAALAAPESEKGRQFPSGAKRYSDSATEFPVIRLTDPGYTSTLPAYYSRPVSHHNNFLLFSCDRTESMQAYRMDLKTAQVRLLTDAQHLDPATVTLLPDERGFCYFDGRELIESSLSNFRARPVYRLPEASERGEGFSISEDGLYAAFIERERGTYKLQLLNMREGTAATVVQCDEAIGDPIARPRRAGILYRRGKDSLWLASHDAQQNYRLKIAAGGLGPALWSPNGRSVLYLNFPEDRTKLHDIREFIPDTNEEHQIAPTSQFAHFGCNGNASVFVGASASKASPYLLLLLRAVKRELTLCEHRASDPARVAPIFSPNSQHVYFQSDRHGKWAIYTMTVDRFVEETNT